MGPATTGLRLRATADAALSRLPRLRDGGTHETTGGSDCTARASRRNREPVESFVGPPLDARRSLQASTLALLALTPALRDCVAGNAEALGGQHPVRATRPRLCRLSMAGKIALHEHARHRRLARWVRIVYPDSGFRRGSRECPDRRWHAIREITGTDRVATRASACCFSRQTSTRSTTSSSETAHWWIWKPHR